MQPSPEQLVQQVHDSPTRIVLVASGGGSRAIADLLEVPGASRTLLEAAVPYSAAALTAWLGATPEEFCSAATARAMGMAAFQRARRYGESTASIAGVACTASLVSDRPKRGAHRIHAALQSAALTATWSLTLQKERRSRTEEERLAGRLVLDVIAEACGISQRLELDLLEGEQVEQSRTVAPPAWQELICGKSERVCLRPAGEPIRIVFPGAFNPLHAGHRRMAEIAGHLLRGPVAVEISVLNVDKPPLDYTEIERRLAQFPPGQTVCLTRAATFEAKSRLFPGATFVVGTDTMQRIADPQYSGGTATAWRQAIERIAGQGCRFLVFGRATNGRFVGLSDLDLPEPLAPLCREVPPDVFRDDVSSTTMRHGRTGDSA